MVGGFFDVYSRRLCEKSGQGLRRPGTVRIGIGNTEIASIGLMLQNQYTIQRGHAQKTYSRSMDRIYLPRPIRSLDLISVLFEESNATTFDQSAVPLFVREAVEHFTKPVERRPVDCLIYVGRPFTYFARFQFAEPFAEFVQQELPAPCFLLGRVARALTRATVNSGPMPLDKEQVFSTDGGTRVDMSSRRWLEQYRCWCEKVFQPAGIEIERVESLSENAIDYFCRRWRHLNALGSASSGSSAGKS